MKEIEDRAQTAGPRSGRRFRILMVTPNARRLNDVSGHAASDTGPRQVVEGRAPEGDEMAIMLNTTSDIRWLLDRLPFIIELSEHGLDTLGSRIFGAIIGSAIFFGIRLYLANADTMVACSVYTIPPVVQTLMPLRREG